MGRPRNSGTTSTLPHLAARTPGRSHQSVQQSYIWSSAPCDKPGIQLAAPPCCARWDSVSDRRGWNRNCSKVASTPAMQILTRMLLIPPTRPDVPYDGCSHFWSHRSLCSLTYTIHLLFPLSMFLHNGTTTCSCTPFTHTPPARIVRFFLFGFTLVRLLPNVVAQMEKKLRMNACQNGTFAISRVPENLCFRVCADFGMRAS